ncbi:Glucan endo-1-3-beta-glucosidase 7 [Nymphaea thermarum]|nr:Glucan endo-1-3-beta-glucosidase 7 [Nymphaea thermarum]
MKDGREVEYSALAINSPAEASLLSGGAQTTNQTENSGSTKHNPANELVVLLRSLGIKKLRIPYPDHNLLKALVNTNVEVNIGIPNEDLLNLALYYEHALRWVDNNIKPYLSSLKIKYITVGDEVFFKGDKGLWYFVLPAMQNVHKALHYLVMDCFSIHVSTSVGSNVLFTGKTNMENSFLGGRTSFIQPILEFLDENEFPLMVNVFSSAMNRRSDYSMGSCIYWMKAFDEVVDKFNWAIKNLGYYNVPIVVSSSGFPSARGEPNDTAAANTLAFNQCLLRRNTNLFSEKPDWIHVYLFTLSNFKYPEDKLEWGLFDLDMCLVYRQGLFS